MDPNIISQVLRGMKRAQFEELLAGCFKQRHCKLIMKAYRLSKYGHRNQKRRTGERYFEHPKALAIMLILLGVRNVALICAALLHDILEDSFILLPEDIGDWFGRDAERLVKKVTHHRDTAKETYFIELLQSGAPRAWILKLSDRLHNLLTLSEGATIDEQIVCRRKKLEQVEETRRFILPMAESLKKSSKKHHRQLGTWFESEITRLCRQRQEEADCRCA